jgi:hypothetical protein
MNPIEKALEGMVNGAEEVDIRYFRLDVDGVRQLMAACCAESSKVTKLNLCCCVLNAEAVEVIASSLRSHSVLTVLYLGGNKDVGPRGAQAIGEILCARLSLKLLYLYECSIGDEGAGYLATALRRNTTLVELSLSNNGIGRVGAAALAAALPFNQTLTLLYLFNNPFGDDGVEVLAKAVPRCGLRVLWLQTTQIGERGCAALVEMLKNTRLSQLRIEDDHWLALDEGFRYSGWLLGWAPAPYIKRNEATHDRARKSVHTLLLIRNLLDTALSSFPKEVVREIAQFLYSTRGETKQRRK